MIDENGERVTPPVRDYPIVHELKCLQPYLGHIIDGWKTFEIRLFDRDYQVGDILLLSEYSQEYAVTAGANHFAYIQYILFSIQKYGLDSRYCVLGIRPATDDEIIAAEKHHNE